MKVGDIVMHRPWDKRDGLRAGINGAWGDWGIVYWAGQDKFGSPHPEPAVSFLNQDSEFIRAAQKDLHVILLPSKRAEENKNESR